MMKEYIINGRKILKERGMLFVDWCKVNNFEYMIDELDWKSLKDEYNLDKSTLTQGFDKKCKWHCSKCGAELNFKVVHRTNGHWDCSYCRGTRLDLRFHSVKQDLENILDEWDYELNDDLPENVSSSSVKKYNWICPQGHLYKSTPHHRKEGKGCPVCANLRIDIGVNDLATTNPELMEEWDFDRNTITPEQVTRGNDKYKIYWVCSKGHSYRASCVSRTVNKTGCPYCASNSQSSFAEVAIFFYLDKLFYNIYRRFKIDGFEFDIYMPDEKILIEYNGYKWHSMKEVMDRDKAKRELALKYNFNLIVINSVRDYKGCNLKSNGRFSEITCFCEKTSLNSVDKTIKIVLETVEKLLKVSLVSSQDFISTKRDFNKITDMLQSDYGYFQGG